DNERGFNEWIRIARQKGFKLEPRSADIPEQSGRIEQAGELIIRQSKALALEANLPRDQLAAELAITVIYIVNHTPTKRLD
ncbi:hypothetical protein EJ04DRAFT_452198, partial [Polyplosphaeria fusca]